MNGLFDERLVGWPLLALASFLAGAVNAVAGGGTILTFPVLGAILPADPARLVTANATSTIGLWPASVVAAWAYRGNREGLPSWARWLVVPSGIGAVIGTLLVLRLPPEWFDTLVPWLILLAAVLFSLQPRVARWVQSGNVTAEPMPAAPVPFARLALACGLQLLVGIYGGYFGAGIGILMLAVLSVLGLGDIHRLNAVKNSLATVVNGVATAVFAAGSFAGSHNVSWPHVGVMAVAGMAGSLGAAHLARRLPPTVMRKIVAIIGFALAGYYFWRQWLA
ncbi:MAG: sulfite exporter TauE/SafE family protein [Planctomycetia bacterium]|nr:sulfite exporter TauE/SafE family protein [Planctomycetia bacterium]